MYKLNVIICKFRFPKEKNKLAQWISACKISGNTLSFLTSQSVICSKHFKKEDFEYSKEDFTNRNGKLKNDVVPSIFNENKQLTQYVVTCTCFISLFFSICIISEKLIRQYQVL